MRPVFFALLCFVALSACKRKGPPPSSSGPGFGEPSPIPSSQSPRVMQAPLRDNSTIGDAADGVSAEVRVLVSSIAAGEPVRIAFRLRPSVEPDKKSPWYQEQIDWPRAASGLEFKLRGPDGKEHALRISETQERSNPQQLAYYVQELSISEVGLGTLAWANSTPKLMTAPGKYSLALVGKLATDQRTLSVASKPVQFEVRTHDDDTKTIGEVEALAANSVAKALGLKKPPMPSAPTIDDEQGNRWVRFTLSENSPGYDVDVIEMLLNPAGKELFVDRFRHFTCVAAGTLIATPRGNVPVETLRLGDEVVAYDVHARVRTTTRIRSIEVAHAERLSRIGHLRLTPNHPVFADGRWVAAGDVHDGASFISLTGVVSERAEPVIGPATVYDLSVDAPHTYFADDILVHNKAAHVPLGGPLPFRGWFYRRAARRAAP